MTTTDTTRPADGPGPDSGHTDAPDAREGLRGAITPETIAELRRVSDLFNEGKMAIPLGPVFHHLPVLLDAAARLAEVTAERDALAASVARVRELHVMHPDDCKCLERMFGGKCFHHGGCEACRCKFPCSTLAALDGSGS